MTFDLKEWVEFVPEWVPPEVMAQLLRINKFHNRSPEKYLEDMKRNQITWGGGEILEFGEYTTMGCRRDLKNYTGRVVHYLNNMIRLVFDDGTYKVFSYKTPAYTKPDYLRMIDNVQSQIEDLNKKADEYRAHMRSLDNENQDSKQDE